MKKRSTSICLEMHECNNTSKKCLAKPVTIQQSICYIRPYNSLFANFKENPESSQHAPNTELDMPEIILILTWWKKIAQVLLL
jgi:hypothetical protein